ncbi:MAG: hypothetical protein AB1546_11650, partial [bacterium]
FDFLGFTHFCDRTRKGKFKLGRKTARARFRQKIKEMNRWLKGIMGTATVFDRTGWGIMGTATVFDRTGLLAVAKCNNNGDSHRF